MKFGAQVNSFDATWDDIHPYIQTMEAGRWDSLWFADHFLPPGARREDENGAAFDGFTLIAVAAGMTKRLKLGGIGDGQYIPQSGAGREDGNDARPGLQGPLHSGARRGWFKREHEALRLGLPIAQRAI